MTKYILTYFDWLKDYGRKSLKADIISGLTVAMVSLLTATTLEPLATAGSISDIDSSGEEALSLTVDRVRSAGIDISLSAVNRSVMKVFRQTHLIVKIGEDHFYPTIESAIKAVHEMTHRGGKEKNCPLTTVCRITLPAQKRGS